MVLEEVLSKQLEPVNSPSLLRARCKQFYYYWEDVMHPLMCPALSFYYKKRSRMHHKNGHFASLKEYNSADGSGDQSDDSLESVCQHCGISEKLTSVMRRGPASPRTLCNACGLMWANKETPTDIKPSTMELENSSANDDELGSPDETKLVPLDSKNHLIRSNGQDLQETLEELDDASGSDFEIPSHFDEQVLSKLELQNSNLYLAHKSKPLAPKAKIKNKKKQALSKKKANSTATWPDLPRKLIDIIAKQPALMQHISNGGLTKLCITPTSKCNHNNSPPYEEKYVKPNLNASFYLYWFKYWYYSRRMRLPVRRLRKHYVGYSGISHPSFVFYRLRGGREWVKQNCTLTEPHGSMKPEGKKNFVTFTNATGFNERFYVLSLQGTLAVIDAAHEPYPRIIALSLERVVPSLLQSISENIFLNPRGISYWSS
ncbi:hypothetical protein PTKIN_Ptkin02bG0158500 [Pterospermum kingtungense]